MLIVSTVFHSENPKIAQIIIKYIPARIKNQDFRIKGYSVHEKVSSLQILAPIGRLHAESLLQLVADSSQSNHGTTKLPEEGRWTSTLCKYWPVQN